MAKRGITSSEREHMARVKQMDCICCTLLGRKQTSPTDCHHIREGQGGAQRAGNFLVLPLCHDDCHQGSNGVHGDKTYLRILKCTELDLLNATLDALHRGR